MMENIKNISSKDLKKYQEDHYVLLDVRTSKEVEKEKIDHPSYTNIDFMSGDFSKEIQTLDDEKTYLVICRSGSRSSHAAKIMRREGYNVIHVEDGMEGWKKEVKHDGR